MKIRRKIYKIVVFLSIISIIGNIAVFIYANSWAKTNIETAEEQAEFLEYLTNDLIQNLFISIIFLGIAIFLLTIKKQERRY